MTPVNNTVDPTVTLVEPPVVAPIVAEGEELGCGLVGPVDMPPWLRRQWSCRLTSIVGTTVLDSFVQSDSEVKRCPANGWVARLCTRF